MNCHYIYEKEFGKVFIPGCWGGAVVGEWYCTCNREPSGNDIKNKEIRELKKENGRLNRVIKKLLNQTNERKKTTSKPIL